MKTFETPKIVELGTLQQIVLSAPIQNNLQDPSPAVHGSSFQTGS